MKLGYARISKADGSTTLDLQVDAPAAAGVAPEHLYQDEAPGKRDDDVFAGFPQPVSLAEHRVGLADTRC